MDIVALTYPAVFSGQVETKSIVMVLISSERNTFLLLHSQVEILRSTFYISKQINSKVLSTESFEEVG